MKDLYIKTKLYGARDLSKQTNYLRQGNYVFKLNYIVEMIYMSK